MDIRPIGNKPEPSQNNLNQQAKAAEAGQLFSKALDKAAQVSQIHAAEETHKQRLRKQKDDIEDGKGMEQEDEEEQLQKKVDKLKTKLKNVLEREQKNLGL